nr:MAG TPA: hypothetical protein [Caudoviricetes sp.]
MRPAHFPRPYIEVEFYLFVHWLSATPLRIVFAPCIGRSAHRQARPASPLRKGLDKGCRLLRSPPVLLQTS